MVTIFNKYQTRSIQRHLFMVFLGAAILFSSNARASDLETSASSHGEFELTEEFLKPYNCVFSSYISDEKWEYLPTTVKSLDISKIGSISEVGLKKIANMKIDTLNLSNLALVDEDLQFLPKGLKKLLINNTTVKGEGLKYLPDTIQEIGITNTSISTEGLKELIKGIKQRNITIEGDGSLLYDIAIMFRDGLGTDKDIKQYIAYCEKACIKDSPLALNQLGIVYELGVKSEKRVIVPINTIKAEEYYKKASQLGSDIAGKNLARVKEANNELMKLFDSLNQEEDKYE